MVTMTINPTIAMARGFLALFFLLCCGLLCPAAPGGLPLYGGDSLVQVEAQAGTEAAPVADREAVDEPEEEKPERCRECLRAKIYWGIGVLVVLVLGIFVV